MSDPRIRIYMDAFSAESIADWYAFNHKEFSSTVVVWFLDRRYP
jgi:hypothetical protein